MKVFVTGATGFVGRVLCEELKKTGAELLTLRRPGVAEKSGGSIDRDLESSAPWDDVLSGVEVVFHLAAYVHQMDGGDTSAYFRINAAATRNLAEAAARVGVRRFVFLSSVKVNGESSATPFRETDTPEPQDAYGKSKLAAELELQRLGEAGFPFVIVRSPLVYGPGVKANFLSLMRLVDRRLPLPLAGIRNRRSLIFVRNLVNVLTTVSESPAAAGQTFLASDGEDLSTPELAARLAAALERPARLFPVPTFLLRAVATLLGKGGQIERLTDSLAVDISKLQGAVGWRAPFSVDDGLLETARWYRRSR